MDQVVYRLDDPPQDPLHDAEQFYATAVAMFRDITDPDACAVAIVFPPASHEHRNWREAAIASMAREFAPRRVNGVVGDDDDAINEALRWLERASGITGQLLAVVPAAQPA